MVKLVHLLLLVALSQSCYAFKILTIFPIHCKSHNILGQGIVNHLLEAGHEVTHMTRFPTHKNTSNYHEIDLSDVSEGEVNYTLQKVLDKEVNIAHAVPRIIKRTKLLMGSVNLQNFLSDSTQNFDVVIVEWFYSDFYAGFATVFECPLIWVSSVELHGLVLRLIHDTSMPSFNSDAVASTVPPFTFVERIKSLFRHLVINAVKFLYFDPVQRALYEEFFGPILTKRGRVLPPYEEVILNGSFMLSNSHPSLTQPIIVSPNIKEIGGYHLNREPKPLPEDLQRLMDVAQDGVIYFSMGTTVTSKDFPKVSKQDILKVFGGVKQTVIWKFEEDLPNRPKNVHVLEWAPQQSILAHRSCRLFITHGGLLSTIEAIYYGVPTIVMPYGADQFLNAMRAVNKGYARKIDLSYKMADEMKLAIEDMLGNPKYSENVKALSKIHHDRPIAPGKELVHWVEHVIKTGGAPHLRSPALMLPWYQKIYLDLAAVIVFVLYGLKRLFSKIISLFRKNALLSKTKTS